MLTVHNIINAAKKQCHCKTMLIQDVLPWLSSGYCCCCFFISRILRHGNGVKKDKGGDALSSLLRSCQETGDRIIVGLTDKDDDDDSEKLSLDFRFLLLPVFSTYLCAVINSLTWSLNGQWRYYTRSYPLSQLLLLQATLFNYIMNIGQYPTCYRK